MRESDIQAEVMIALSRAGCVVWRNNVAQAWVGEYARTRTGDVLIKNARPLHAGLCVGSSDVIGIAPDGRFLAVEVKSKRGTVTDDQHRFIEAVIRAGGVAGVARSAGEAVALLTNAQPAE